MKSLVDISGSTILVVDDNPVNVGILQNILDKSGYRTVSATSGAECIEAVSKFDPDLVLLDIYMPQMSGIEVCTLLMQDNRTNDMPVIFVTANTDNEVLKEAFEAGGADYVCKPVNKVELLARVKSTLTQKKLTEMLFMEEKLNGVLEMAGAVSHEMNQPLQAVSGISELILWDISEDNPLYEHIRKIKEQIIRMGDITRKLMRITTYKTKDYIGDLKIIDIDKATGS
jgi:CheY-like chemotaxis protein